MAESKRNIEHVSAVGEDERQTQRDRYTLLFFGFGGIAVVALMFWIAGFLSGQADEAVNPPLFVAAGGGVLALVFYLLFKRV